MVLSRTVGPPGSLATRMWPAFDQFSDAEVKRPNGAPQLDGKTAK
jgi:hypothetical protein